MIRLQAASIFVTAWLVGCPEPDPRRLDAATDAPAGDVPGNDTPSATDAPRGADAPLDTPSTGTDGSELRSAAMPNLYACGQSSTINIVMANIGTTTWLPAEHALVAVGGSDSFSATTRFAVAAPVAPGGTASFDIPTIGPMTGGAYVSDWQMARGASPFGPVASRPVAVNCAGADSIDLRGALVHASPPGYASWPITASITALDIAPNGGVGNGGIVPTFTRGEGPERWPDVPFLGGTEPIYYTLWFALNIGGRWHVAGAQQYWYATGLRMCGIPSGWTANLFYDAGRWGEMASYPIADGEIIGVFLASGDHRSRTDTDGSSILERTAVVLMPFPGDTTITYSF